MNIYKKNNIVYSKRGIKYIIVEVIPVKNLTIILYRWHHHGDPAGVYDFDVSLESKFSDNIGGIDYEKSNP